MRFGGFFFALLLLFWAAPARAETTNFALIYRAALDCPDRDAFIAELTARSPWLRESPAGAQHVSLEVWFESGDPLMGVIVLRDSEARITMRRIPGASCQEVTSALALVASVLIDAQRDAQRREAAIQAAAPAPEPEPAPAPTPVTTATVPAQEDQAPPSAEEEPDAEHEWRFRPAVAAGVALEQGVAPNTAVAGALELSGEWTAPSVLQPLLSATFERTLTDETRAGSGVARFRWTAVRLGACLLRLPAESAVFFRPCLHVEGGVIDASGAEIDDTEEVTSIWAATGISERLEFNVLEPLSFVLELGARVHLNQDRFYFDPDSPETTVFEVPGAGVFARIGAQAIF